MKNEQKRSAVEADSRYGKLNHEYDDGFNSGFDAAYSLLSGEVEKLQTELAQLKQMVDAAVEIKFGGSKTIAIIRDLRDKGVWWLFGMPPNRTIPSKHDSPTEAFTAISGGTK